MVKFIAQLEFDAEAIRLDSKEELFPKLNPVVEFILLDFKEELFLPLDYF